jgi:hypothetical protein
LSPQKTFPIALQDKGIVFSIFPWAVLCDAISTCHFVSRSVWLKSPVTTLWRNLLPLTVYQCKIVRACFIDWSLCYSWSKQESQWAQTFHYLLDHSLPCSNLSCHFHDSHALILCDDLILLFFPPTHSVEAVCRQPYRANCHFLCSHL